MNHAKKDRGLMVLMMSLIVLTPMGVDIFLPSLPILARDFALDTEHLRWSVTLYLISMGAGQVLIGPLVDWLGRRRMAIIGALLYCLAATVCLLADQLVLFYTGRLLQGLGASMATVVAFSCVRDRFNGEHRASIYSFLNAAVCVIPALAPLLGSLLASLWHWRATFIFMAVFALLVTLACVRWLEETMPAAARPAYHPKGFLEILNDRRFLFYALIATTGMTAILIYVTTAPILLMDQAGLSEIAFGSWFGMVAALNVVAYFLAPRLIRCLGQRGAIHAGLAIMVAGGAAHALTVMASSGGVASFMLCNALLVTGFSFTLGAALSLALEPYAERAGLASSLMGCLQMGGGALCASLMTLLPLSPQWMLALTGVGGAGALLLTSLCYIPLREHLVPTG